jgi:hypothetical protein
MSVTYYSYADLVSRNPDNSLEIYLSYLNGRPSSDTTFLKGNLVVTALPNITIPGLDERKVKYALEQDASAQQNTQTTKTKVGAMDPWLLSIGLAGLGLRRRRRRAPRGGSAQP